MAANSSSPVRPTSTWANSAVTSATSATRSRLSASGYVAAHGLHIAFLIVNVDETINVSGTGWGKAFQVNNGTTTLCVAVARGDVSADCTFTWTTAATGRIFAGYVDSPMDPFSSTALDNVGANSDTVTSSGTSTSLASINSSGTLGAFLYTVATAAGSSTSAPASPWAEYADISTAPGALVVGWQSYFETAIASGALSLTHSSSLTRVTRLWDVRIADAVAGLMAIELEVSTLVGPQFGLFTTELEIATLLAPAPPAPGGGRGRRLILIN